MGHLKQHIQVALSAIVSVSLLTAPLYAVDLPNELASVNAVVEDNIAETRSTGDTLRVPAAEEVDEGHARVYFSDREEWEAIPADTPARFRGYSNGVFWNDADAGRLASVGGLYSGNAAVELEDGGVYVVSHARAEPLLNNPAKVAGYTPPPTEGDIELLPEREERLTFDLDRAGMGLWPGFLAGFLLTSLVQGGVENADPGVSVVAGLVGGVAGSVVSGFQQRQREHSDNIAENTRRRREVEREQRQIESENEGLLESANEEIREQNRHQGYILIEEVESGQTTHLWVSE